MKMSKWSNLSRCVHPEEVNWQDWHSDIFKPLSCIFHQVKRAKSFLLCVLVPFAYLVTLHVMCLVFQVSFARVKFKHNKTSLEHSNKYWFGTIGAVTLKSVILILNYCVVLATVDVNFIVVVVVKKFFDIKNS